MFETLKESKFGPIILNLWCQLLDSILQKLTMRRVSHVDGYLPRPPEPFQKSANGPESKLRHVESTFRSIYLSIKETLA